MHACMHATGRFGKRENLRELCGFSHTPAACPDQQHPLQQRVCEPGLNLVGKLDISKCKPRALSTDRHIPFNILFMQDESTKPKLKLERNGSGIQHKARVQSERPSAEIKFSSSSAYSVLCSMPPLVKVPKPRLTCPQRYRVLQTICYEVIARTE